MPVRVATIEDAGAIARVHVESWQHAYRDILPADYLARLSVDHRRAMWTASIAEGGPTTVLVADTDGHLAGFAAVGPCRDKDAAAADQEIWAIYVAPLQWARGVGHELWNASWALAVERGAARLSLWVFASNTRAKRFYECVAMQAEPGSVKTFELGGVTLEELRYVLRLNGAEQGSSQP